LLFIIAYSNVEVKRNAWLAANPYSVTLIAYRIRVLSFWLDDRKRHLSWLATRERLSEHVVFTAFTGRIDVQVTENTISGIGIDFYVLYQYYAIP